MVIISCNFSEGMARVNSLVLTNIPRQFTHVVGVTNSFFEISNPRLESNEHKASKEASIQLGRSIPKMSSI